MLHIKLDDKLIQELKELQNQFTIKFAQIDSYSEDAKDYIRKLARARIIGGSTRIENAQLTDSEIYWLDTLLESDSKTTAFVENKKLIEDKLSKDRERSIEEVAGCRQMLQHVFDQSKEMMPLKENDIRALHYELLFPHHKGGPYIGAYKIQPNSVVERNLRTKETRVVFKTSDAGPITEAAMHDLVSWHNTALSSDPWPMAVTCEFVYRFLAIHPFQDGNGRLGRGLFLLALLQSNDNAIAGVIPYIAIDRHIEKHREEYYAVLNKCSNGIYHQDPRKYQMEYFLRFMIKILQKSLGDIDVYYSRYAAISLLSEGASKIYECFKNYPELRLTRQEIVKITGLPIRTVGYGLSQLTETTLIQRYGQGAGVRYQITF
ncbi:MAG: Fic family protein [Alphaproteobacteria bacterium]